ncbi:MAG: hypothetical protein ACOCZL_00720 [Bacteroidota bacterium]
MIRLLLILALIYLLVRLIGRAIFPPSSGNQRRTERGKKEGDVTIENKNTLGKIINKDEGEYIDYEEMK